MGRFIKALLAAVIAAALTGAIILFGATEGWGRKRIAPPGDAARFATAVAARLDRDAVGNAAFILVEHGKPVSEHFVSKGAPVDRDTQFQVASLSKWATAWGVMALVDEGKLDLDAPVSRYLTRWRLPAGQFDNDKVTVRRLLSHTAGLTDGLGYAGFTPGTPVQSLEASLTHAADASPGADGSVHVGIEPGSAWEYSGGGYTLLQLVIEEVSGQTFNEFMTRSVFVPLGMTRSTYVLEAPETNVAEIYDTDGSRGTRFNFTSLAATSLYTSAADMAGFIAAHSPGPNGEPVGRGVLKPETVRAMRRPEASKLGVDIWGLGVMLYAPNPSGDFVIGHDGDNEPAINTSVRLDPSTGDGIVLLETGNKLLATKLAGEWVLWDAGRLDFLIVTMELKHMLKWAAIGAGVAFLLVFALVWRLARRRKPRASQV
ncbi:MAG: serine hydrolase [Brevundimonas subvibrioides]|uniref:Serine hydrolase n=1 Tax=Brevundimonas subvibrioides TaxID=74313 RepID=A0A258HKP2_9CAUL|nr:serine hydrolase domain-containing protein [Brevundimonas subvibrioides]OYX56922.1 MAG: serine hydrolase [Brevundimonas subvibrioides]